MSGKKRAESEIKGREKRERVAANDIKEERREESAKKGKQMHDGLTFGKQERKNDQSHLSPPLFFSFTCSDAAFERKREREGERERVWETERENEREREDEGSELRESKRTKRERERKEHSKDRTA